MTAAVAPSAPATGTAPGPASRGRFTNGLIYDVLQALERYGYSPATDRSVGQVVGLLYRLAGVYEGSLTEPCDPEVTL